MSDIQKHGKCHDHSVAAEAYLMKTSGETIIGTFSRMTSLNKEAVMAAMRNIYWLAKENIATLKYNYLYVRENAKFTSPKVVKEMVFVISQCFKNDIQQELQQSPFYRDKDMKIHDCPKLCEFKKAYDKVATFCITSKIPLLKDHRLTIQD